MKLQSMTDFVLAQERKYPCADEKDYHETNDNTLQLIIKYANLLKQPLELWMFVPCDDNGNVLKEPIDDEICDFCPLEKKGVYSVPGGYVAGCEGSRCEDAKDNFLDVFEESKQRVLFEGFEVVETLSNRRAVKHKDVQFYIMWTSEDSVEFKPSKGLGSIEDLIKYGLTLTESAIKQLNL